MIYLATPYSHPDPAVREFRYQEACRIAAKFINSGEVVYSPIAHNHPLAQISSLPFGFEFWEKYDRSFIRLCSKVVVCKMDGWAESKGVSAEIRIAEELHKPVEFIEV